MTTLGPFLLGLSLAAVVLLPLLLAARGRVADMAAQAGALEQELGGLTRSKVQLEADRQFLDRFMTDFPHLARDLFTGLRERQVPWSVLSVIRETFDPAHAAVFVRRGHGEGDLEESRFVVAAAVPESGLLALGAEVPIATGEIGFAATARIVVTRQDLEAEAAKGGIKPGPDLFGVFAPELLAPLVFERETLGVVALSRPRKTSGDVTAALRLIAQTGAQALKNAALNTQIKVTAEMDGLTRVFNRKHMEQALSEIVYRSASAGRDHRDPGTRIPVLSVLLFDIDHFKHYNDTNGHLAGDKLLQELAHLVPQSIRKDDIFGRYGGEEFLLILPNTNLRQGLATANKIRAMVAAHRFPFAERQPLGSLSVSGGVAEYPHHGRDAQGLLHAADDALYEAKQQGRNRVAGAATAPAAAVPTPERGLIPGPASRQARSL